ncbi:unnamed protein product [Phytophthora lilii]|uniref:Unnamed protein product n=1 Tax=Phytophthora lilii TaxID=2077276 RepID=A0A9W6U4Z5_9STRA|nr:unnamed protein product [Phytophthora lilii]
MISNLKSTSAMNDINPVEIKIRFLTSYFDDEEIKTAIKMHNRNLSMWSILKKDVSRPIDTSHVNRRGMNTQSIRKVGFELRTMASSTASPEAKAQAEQEERQMKKKIRLLEKTKSKVKKLAFWKQQKQKLKGEFSNATDSESADKIAKQLDEAKENEVRLEGESTMML